MPDQIPEGAFVGFEDDDPEVDALNESADNGDAEGFYARDMEGQIRWHAYPERERCGGHGSFNCYCGGDFCCCGNGGEIECFGCADCGGDDDDWYPNDD